MNTILKKKCLNTTTHSPLAALMIHTDEKVESYASQQCDVADSLKREHILKVPVIPKKAAVLVQTFLWHRAMAPAFLQEGGDTVYALLNCGTVDDPKFQYSDLTLPHRRTQT